MNLPINHLIKTLDRCCGQWEFVNEPCNTALMRTYVVRFFNTGMVYSVAFLDGHWTTASAWLQNRLNGKTRDDAGELQRIVSVEVVDGWNVWRNPPPDFVIQSGDEYNWGIFEPDRWKPFVAAVGGPLKRFADTSAYPFSIRRRIAQPSLPSDFDCVPEPMEAPFRAGDWVVCVDDSASSGITVGSVYLVLGLDESGDPELTCDDGYRSYYLALRFRRARPDEIPQTVNQIPCGGCGAKTSKERCIGCFHNFGDEPQPATPRTPADAPPTLQQSNAEICRQNGWTVGTVLEGDEGLGPEQIEITAIGKDCVLACRETDEYESLWSLKYRQWKVVSPPALQLREGAWYERRDGKIVGPCVASLLADHPWKINRDTYTDHGTFWEGPIESRLDLLREVPPPQPDSEGWIKHDGKGCPVDQHQSVEVRFRDYRTRKLKYAGTHNGCWKHTENEYDSDIVAYRIVTPAPTQPQRDKKLESILSQMNGTPDMFRECVGDPRKVLARIERVSEQLKATVPGTHVVCLVASSTKGALRKGTVYKIKSKGIDFFNIDGRRWSRNRFRLATIAEIEQGQIWIT